MKKINLDYTKYLIAVVNLHKHIPTGESKQDLNNNIFTHNKYNIPDESDISNQYTMAHRI